MVLLFAFLVSITISIVLIPVLMRYAGSLNLVDEPDERKVHTVSIPRCGGLGLSAGAIGAMLLYLPVDHHLYSLVYGSLVIVVFGLMDDQFELNYKWKFFGQFLAVFCVIFQGINITFIPFFGLEPVTSYFTLPLTLIFAIGVTNAVNLSDGLDGLAAGIMLLTLATIAFLAIDTEGIAVASVAIAVAGGIVGFLWFNTHPAVVFMGDTGSQFIGFIAVFLSVYLTQNLNQALNPALPLLLFGLPILDTLSVMVRRIRAGRSPFSPDKTHIHHRLIEYGFTHAEAVGFIYLLQGIFLASALYFRYSSDIVVIGNYLLISVSILLFFYFVSTSQWKLHKVKGERNRRGNPIWRNEKLFQFCGQYINYSLTIFLALQLFCLIDRIVNLSMEVYLAMIFTLVLIYCMPKFVQDVWVRFSIYVAAIFANVMGNEFPEIEILRYWIIDLFLFFMIVVVSVAIRITRKSKFMITTQDVLVVLFIIASILLIDVKLIENVTFRLFCLVYALEYILHRKNKKLRLSRNLAVFSGVLIIAIVLPTIF